MADPKNCRTGNIPSLTANSGLSDCNPILSRIPEEEEEAR